jgi:hypothetical protein
MTDKTRYRRATLANSILPARYWGAPPRFDRRANHRDRDVQWFMLPDSNDQPTGVCEPLGLEGIACSVALELALPELIVGSWHRTVKRTQVPETAIDEDRDPQASEGHIRSDKAAVSPDRKVLAESKSRCMKRRPKRHLGFGVSALHRSHVQRAPGRGSLVTPAHSVFVASFRALCLHPAAFVFDDCLPKPLRESLRPDAMASGDPIGRGDKLADCLVAVPLTCKLCKFHCTCRTGLASFLEPSQRRLTKRDTDVESAAGPRRRTRKGRK